jgi:hypothetical protein
MRGSNIFGRLASNLPQFIVWATGETSFSEVHSEVGSVKTVHLYRERDAPLHHEFALVSFSGEGIKRSWMRVERAALLKSRKYVPNWDSFGPIFRGAPLRETVSVGPTKDELSGDAEEIAAVQLGESRMSAPLYLDEFAKQLLNTSQSRPSYQLLTANCRWFARSTC